LTPLILWPDRRAETLNGQKSNLWHRDEFLDTTGVGVESIEFCPHKLEWLRCNQPMLWNSMASIMTISDYLVFGLTGRRLGDRSTASMTGLWDQRNRCWWRDGLRQIDVTEWSLSVPLLSGTFIGGMTRIGALRTGLGAGTSVVVGALDHVAAAVGAGLGTIADASESTGTVLACVTLTKEYVPCQDVCIGPALRDGEFYYLSFADFGTSLLDAYQSQHLPGLAIQDVIRLAEEAPVGAAGVRIAPERTCAELDNSFLHHKEWHEPRHFVRAILEDNAFALHRLIDTLPGPRPQRIVATGGGARSETWLQVKADLLGVEVVQVDCEEPACQGAAMFAAAASGRQAGLDGQPDNFVRVKRRFTPHPARHEEYCKLMK
jgi:sugar (pentulose or hexulose) kinase